MRAAVLRMWTTAVILACVAVTPTFGELYMYRGADGSIHFSNAPSSRGYRRYHPKGSNPYVRKRVVDRPHHSSFDHLIVGAARRHAVDPALVKAVIRAESAFVPHARSPKGAQGLMQLMPATARMHRVWRILEPDQNIEGGTKHLRLLLDRYDGNVRLALAAYNAGDGAVERYGGVPPYPETQQYIRRVFRFRDHYSRQF